MPLGSELKCECVDSLHFQLRNRMDFISYDSVDAIRSLKHLAHTNDTILAEYEEKAEVV